MKGADGTQYESKNIEEILSQNGILDTRRIVSIEMSYFNYANKNSILIRLSHTVRDYEDYEGKNYISVSGLDELWVKGVIKSFEDITSNWEKQENWPYRYSWLLTIVFQVVIGLIFLIISKIILTYVVVIPQISSKREFLLYLFIFISGFWLSSLPTWYMVDKIKELYPIVELRTGPENAQVEVKKRKNFYTTIRTVISIVIGIIAPFILGLIK